MDRRKFMAASIGSIFLSKYSNAESLLKKNNLIRKNLFSDNTTLTFGDSSLLKLRDDYHHYLFEDFLPFMDKYVIDDKYGGFMCNTDLSGKNINTDKATWTEGRGIWVYSFLYRNFGKKEKYLDVAHNSLNLILKTKPIGDALWPDTISREGNALTPSSKQISGDILIAEGLNEYARASGEWEYWNLAKDIILKCWKIYNNPDYYPGIVTNYQGPDVFPFPGAKIQGVSMIMIITINRMLESKNDPDLEKIISACTDAVINKHFNPEFNLNNELLNHDYTCPNNELSQFVYTGISIETLWPIMERAIKLKDVNLFQIAAERFKRHVEVAWDGVYGGVFRSLNNVDKNLWEVERLCKVLWAQQEVLNGIIILIEQTGDEWAKNWWFEKMYKYLTDKYLLKQYGYPLWIFQADRKVTFEQKQQNQTIENYHLPRHLMLTYLAIDRIIKNKGKPVWTAAMDTKDRN
jgi:mannose/cellobiose epimerase-like protein (N-acyl-D-glucosamine 2-epimerase family)